MSLSLGGVSSRGKRLLDLAVPLLTDCFFAFISIRAPVRAV